MGKYTDNMYGFFGVENCQGVNTTASEEKMLKTVYTNKDKAWVNGPYEGYLYLSVPDETHKIIENIGKGAELPESGYPGIKGFFTNEDTASQAFVGNSEFDAVKFGEMTQQMPHFDKEAEMDAIAKGEKYHPEYNHHLDCFRFDPDACELNYGVREFRAAQGVCQENQHAGAGGGMQGYNPYINEMINNGTLEYVPERSKVSCNSVCFDYAERRALAEHQAGAVAQYLQENPELKKTGSTLGYNELPARTEFSPTGPRSVQQMSSSNIASIGGGGARAPNQAAEVPSGAGKEDLSNILSPRAAESTPIAPAKMPSRTTEKASGFAGESTSIAASDAAEGAQKAARGMTGGMS